MVVVLAGDIGGTNSRLALYEGDRSIFERTYRSAQQPSLEAAVQQFLKEAAAAAAPGGGATPARACLAVAGPVEGGKARITNLPWSVDERQLAAGTGVQVVRLVNDFEAAASGIPLLRADDLIPLGGEAPHAKGPVVVTGPGTGLGTAFLFWSEAAGHYEVMASEGGHADFAPNGSTEQALATTLSARYQGHVSVERVLSGPGLRDIFSFLREEPAKRRLASPETLAVLEKNQEDPAAVIVRQAVAGRDPLCVLTVHLFLSVLGAHAGNLALTVLATGGVYIAGGIAPRLRSLLAESPLREAFEAKGRMRKLLTGVPIFVVTQGELGLLGAAAIASRS
jgi:glucokinase